MRDKRTPKDVCGEAIAEVHFWILKYISQMLLNLWEKSKEELHREKKMTGDIKHYHVLKGFIFVIYTNKLRISSSEGTAPFLVKTKSSCTS